MKRFGCCFSQRRQQSGSDEEDNRNPPAVNLGTMVGGRLPRRSQQPALDIPGPSQDPPGPTQDPSGPTQDPSGLNQELLDLGGVTFTYAEILDATGSFQTSNCLGFGGFGEVYRGHFNNPARDVAVKIHDQWGRQGEEEFIAEVKLLQRADHPNLIKFIGHCTSSSHRVTVYEFMPLGSVDQHLFGERRPLKWETRMKIALGTARGLDYVHTRMNVIHRDIKAENILLDENFEPKLTDFDLAKEAPAEEEDDTLPMQSSRIAGTLGYIAPEYERYGLLSLACDTYSYGVFLIQLLTGRRAHEIGRPRETRNLVEWVRQLWDKEENLPLLADPKLGRRFSMNGLRHAFMAARWCVHPHPSTRPDMTMVASLVSEASEFPVDNVPENTTEERRHTR